MKRLIVFLLLFAAIEVAGQTTGYLRFDTVKIMKQNGTCELYIINSTKDSLGLLTNVGGGLTRFIKSRSLNDSTIIIGLDTIVIRGATGGSAGPVGIGEVVGGYGLINVNDSTLRADTASPNGLVTRTELLDSLNKITITEKPVIVKAGSDNSVSDTLALLYDDDHITIDGDSALTINPSNVSTVQRLIDSAAAIRADFPAGGSGISGLTAGRVTLSTGATTVGDDSRLLFDATQNKLEMDSANGLKARVDSLHLNRLNLFTADSSFGLGNSITNSNNATSSDSGYAQRLAASLNLQHHNGAVSGRGIVTMVDTFHRYINPGHSAFTIFMPGFNDLRRNNIFGATGRKTLNKVINGVKSVFANQYLKTYTPATHASVTRYGSGWNINWDASLEAGKTTAGAYTAVDNDSLVYNFTDTTLIIGLIGQVGTSGSFIGGPYSIYIDHVLARSGNTNLQADGVDDGFGNSGSRSPMCEIFTGLSSGAHTVRVVNNSTGTFIVDYFGHLVDKTVARPMIMVDPIYNNIAGYAVFPDQSSVEKTDTLLVKFDSLIATFPDYPVFRAITNNVFDTLTGLDDDDIHPNDLGHFQIFQSALIGLGSANPGDGNIVTDGLYFYGYAGGQKRFAYYQEIRAELDEIEDNGGNGIIGGSGLTNRVAKFSATKVLTNSNITDNGTTVSASTPLSVTGLITTTGSGSGLTVNRRDNSNLAYSMYSSAGDLQWFSGSNDKMRLTNAGLLAIGANVVPDRQLHVEVSDAGTTTVPPLFRLTHVTSGTSAAGFGVSMEFELEHAGAANDTSSVIESNWEDPTNNVSNAALVFRNSRNMNMAEGFRLFSDGTGRFIGGLNIGSVSTGTAGTDSLLTITNTGVRKIRPGFYATQSALNDTAAAHWAAITSISGGGISGSGTSGRVAFWDGASSITSDANYLYSTSNAGTLSLGTSATRGHFNVGGNRNYDGTGSSTAWGLGLYSAATTYTDNVTSAAGSTNFAQHYLEGATIAASNSSVTVTSPMTLRVDGPAAGTNVTITGVPYAIAAFSPVWINGAVKTVVGAASDGGTVSYSSNILTCDATSGNFNVNLPSAATYSGFSFTFKRIDNAGNTCTVSRSGSDTIDGATSYSLTAQYKYVKVVSDGTNWLVIANN